MAEGDLVRAVALFSRLLHDLGLTIGTDRVMTATRALATVDLGDTSVCRDALRACFVSSREELEVFEVAFDAFWTSSAVTATEAPVATRHLRLAHERAQEWIERLHLKPVERLQERRRSLSRRSYSEAEQLRQKDFEELSYDEAEQVKRLLRQAPWEMASRRTRRWRPARRGAIDARRTARSSVRLGGEALRLQHRQRRVGQRPLVLLCDVSGSMAGYTRMLLVFAHAVGSRRPLETFVFSTRLTRITRMLGTRDADRVLSEVGRRVHDLSGGTRIGQAVGEFNRRWARRTLGHGAVVLVISDGWDRGEPERVAIEVARLRRTSHRLIWLNPLLGSKDYEPLTRGMAAALPHTDQFLAAHNLASLEHLGRILGSLEGARRAGRRR